MVEQNDVDYLFGLAKNTRLIAEIAAGLPRRPQKRQSGSQPGAQGLPVQNAQSWSRQRRVVGKAEWMILPRRE